MQLEAKKCLEDVRQAAEPIVQFTAGKSFADYDSDALVRSAVERQFEIIGEAIGRLAKFDRTLANTLPEAPRIIAFRNILIHSYDVIDNHVVWDVIKKYLPELQTKAVSLMSTDE